MSLGRAERWGPTLDRRLGVEWRLIAKDPQAAGTSFIWTPLIARVRLWGLLSVVQSGRAHVLGAHRPRTAQTNNPTVPQPTFSSSACGHLANTTPQLQPSAGPENRQVSPRRRRLVCRRLAAAWASISQALCSQITLNDTSQPKPNLYPRQAFAP